MPLPPSKRARTRSPSPSLPLHLLTSLPSSSALSPLSADPALARLPEGARHGIRAEEARLLDLRLKAAEAGGRVRWAGSTEGTGEVWTDRYDILHLLPSLPPPAPSSPSSSLPSTRGFAALPPTHEEAFYFTPLERLSLERTAARRRREDERDARVREAEAREAAERAERDAADAAERATQLALMRRLHATLSSSPNPALLELRILANHASDARFAFLRPGARGGRWRDVWERIRAGEKVGEEGQEGKAEGEREKGGMAGLAAYGSSDEEEDDDEGGGDGEAEDANGAEGEAEGKEGAVRPEAGATTASPSAAVEAPALATGDGGVAEEEERRKKQEAKAEKAREWARKRRAAKEAESAA